MQAICLVLLFPHKSVQQNTCIPLGKGRMLYFLSVCCLSVQYGLWLFIIPHVIAVVASRNNELFQPLKHLAVLVADNLLHTPTHSD